MKKTFIVIFYIFFFVYLSTAQNGVINGFGDLYVIHNDDESIRVVAQQADGTVLDTIIYEALNDLKMHYYAADKDTDVDFEFQLHKRIKNS